MKDFYYKIILICLSAFVIWSFYKQSKRIDYLEETIEIQHEAITKQNFLVDYQKFYINFLETQHNQIYNPIIRSPYNKPI